ncbi:cytochrome P450 [Dentipellis sp. KUC8613]|nr:cytochrome P450 [Dentipellis sp. KUC8613]
MTSLSSLILVVAFPACYLLYKVIRTRYSLRGLRGPPSPSFWIGNQQDILYQKEVGDVEFKWMREYGSAWRLHGCLGEDQLMIADPKAIQYVLHTSGYRFPKHAIVNEDSRLTVGDGLIWAHGEDHKRQRKIMSPAFTAPQLKSFLGLFQEKSSKLVQKWNDEIGAADPVINIAPWLSRLTLDIMGIAGFNFDFGALDDAENEVNEAYRDLVMEGTLYRTKFDVVMRSLWKYIPEDVLHLVRYLPLKNYARYLKYTTFMTGFAKEVFHKSELKGTGNDVISVLQRANAAEDPKKRLVGAQLYDQVSTVLLAGHDTTAFTLTWFFWELAKNVSWQTKIREEIMAVRANVATHGDLDFSVSDLEGMTNLNAALKESMRLHPILWQLFRMAGQDDVIPLDFPIVTESGKTISSIPVRKGQDVTISVSAYSRIPQVWGEDADKFNPDRFLRVDKTKQTTVGLHANLVNFSGGIRGCIGPHHKWTCFSLIEQQAIAAALLENFEFSLSDEKNIKRIPSALMVPVAEGHEGAWLGLRVRSIR